MGRIKEVLPLYIFKTVPVTRGSVQSVCTLGFYPLRRKGAALCLGYKSFPNRPTYFPFSKDGAMELRDLVPNSTIPGVVS